MIIDSHCHLDYLLISILKEKNINEAEAINHISCLDQIIEDAKNHGVDILQTISTKLSDFDLLSKITSHYENIFMSVGVHPSEVVDVCTIEEIIDLCNKNHKVISIGETGLDYFYNKNLDQQKNQRDSFDNHIKASMETNLPVVIHTRAASKDTVDILKHNKADKDFPALIHCFTETKDFLSKVLDMGLYISISGIVTFKNAKDLQEMLNYIPLDRLLVETDSPYLAPAPMRGKQNQPAYTKYVVEFIADYMNKDVDYIADVTTNNFNMLFSKVKNI